MAIFATVYSLGLLTSHFTVFACSTAANETEVALYVTTSRVLTAPCQPPVIVSEPQDIMKIMKHLTYETFRSMLIGDFTNTQHLVADVEKSKWKIILREIVVDGGEYNISVVGKRILFDLIQPAHESHGVVRGAYIIETFEFTGQLRVCMFLREVSVLKAGKYRVLDSVADVSLTSLRETIRRKVVLGFNSSFSSAACRLT